MTEQPEQQLSALIDGELDPASGRFLLRRLQHERELAGRWERWHLIRDCLQRQRVTPLREDFVDRIAAALADEARPAARGGALRWVGGLAVAASVAVAALLAVPSPAPMAPPAAPAIASEVVPSGLSERDLRPNLGPVAHAVSATQGQSLTPTVRLDPMVEAWLLRHNAATQRTGQDGFVPYIPLVSPPRQWTMVPPPAPDDRR